MSRLLRVGLTMLLVVFLGIGVRWIYLRGQPSLPEPASAPVAVSNQLWQTSLQDYQGKSYALAQYQGKPLVINFWATWCAPCREEMPEISELAKQYPQIAVLGLAIDDVESVRAFGLSTPVSYPLLIAENEGMPLAEALGNTKGVLPYTVIISAQGGVTRRFFGRINRQMLLDALHLPSSPS